MFERTEKNPDKIDNIEDKGEEILKKKIEPIILPGPYKIKMEVIKKGNFRIDGKLYEMMPGSTFDGAKLDPRKLEILVNTKYVRKV